MKDDLPNTITATQSSLAAAQESAEVIDSVLNALSFLPGIDYNPEVPLHVALGKVSESLNDLPGTFTEMQASLKDAGRNMEVIQADLPVVAEQIGQIEASMTGYKAIIKSYQDSLAELQKRLAKSEANLPALLTFLALALTIFFLWMAVAQLGLFMQGRELLLHQKQEKEQPAEKDPAGNDKSSEPHAGGVL
jgi:DNA repair ATPase RecN